MGKVKCKVCGFEFAPLKEDHYVVRDTTVAGIGVLAAHVEPGWFDAWDCPMCGAQYAATYSRLRELDEVGEPQCDGCKNEALPPDNYPCLECARCWEDLYEPLKEAEHGDQ